MPLYKRGNVWWVNFWEGNYHVQRTTKCRNKREAETVERAYRTQIAMGEVGIEPKKAIPLFSAAMKDFLAWSKHEHAAHPNTHKRYETSSKALLRYFNDKPLDGIKKDDVQNFKVWRIKQKSPRTKRQLKPATVNRELACLKILLNRYVMNDALANNPVSRVKFLNEDNEQMRVLSADEERLYLMACSQPLQDVATVMVETGARPDEVCKLRLQDVNLAKGYLSIPYGKTKAARRKIPLTDKAQAVLERRCDDAEGEYLFAGGRGSNNGDKPVIKLNRAHNGAVARSKVAWFRLYDLRHTFATRATEAGIDLVTLAALLGHSRVQMVMRYAHPTEEHQFAAIQKMQAFRGQKNPQAIAS